MSVIDKATGTAIYAPGNTNARGQLTDYINAGGTLCTTLQYDIYGLPTFVQTVLAAGGIALQNLETQFDPQTGNLNYRKDKKIQVNGSDLTETFTYDLVHKNRLASWQVTGQPQFTMTYADNNGNILTKSDITSAGNPYIYTDQYNALTKPHAVKSINAPLLVPAEPQQDITYNSFNKVQQLTHTKQGLRLEIMYGPDEQRVKSDFYVNNVLAKTKYFVGGDYEVEVLPDNSERRLHYLPGGGLYVCDKNNVKIGMYYVLTDYQGNWYKVVTETGSLVEQYSFDAWGKRRNATNWSYAGVPTTFIFDRGYTGHEMLDAFGLINMNGRVYDPVIARFLSPDNYVQAPDNSQGLNRYTYCMNNPLMYTDPSGDFFWVPVMIGALMYGTVNTIIHKNRGDIHNFWDGLKYFTQGAVMGAVVGATWSLGFAGVSSSNIWAQVGGYAILGGKAVNFVTTFASGISNFGNAGKILMGRAYTDENRGFLGGLWQGISRHTWEGLQTWVGYNFTQARNTAGGVDRVDYLGGATFATGENRDSRWGVTISNYINISITDEIGDDFEGRVISDPLFMHEYGHTFDSQIFGLSYLFAIGLPSLMSANNATQVRGEPYGVTTHDFKWYEMRANRHAANYFGKLYGVNWLTFYRSGTIETYYPRRRR